MPKGRRKRKNANRKSGINTPQLESQSNTAGTAEKEATKSRFDQYFGPFGRVYYPFIELSKAQSFKNIQETISCLDSLFLYVDKSRSRIKDFAEQLHHFAGRRNWFQPNSQSWYGLLLKFLLRNLIHKPFFYPRHVFAAYKRHPEFRGSIIFSHFLLGILLFAVYLRRQSVVLVPVLLINLPILVFSSLIHLCQAVIALATILIQLVKILIQVFTVHGLKIIISLCFLVGYPPLGRAILLRLYRIHDDLRRAELQTDDQ